MASSSSERNDVGGNNLTIKNDTVSGPSAITTDQKAIPKNYSLIKKDGKSKKTVSARNSSADLQLVHSIGLGVYDKRIYQT